MMISINSKSELTLWDASPSLITQELRKIFAILLNLERLVRILLFDKKLISNLFSINS